MQGPGEERCRELTWIPCSEMLIGGWCRVCLMHVDAEAKHIFRVLPDLDSDWSNLSWA